MPLLFIYKTVGKIMNRILSILIGFIAINVSSQDNLKGKYCSLSPGESDVICVDFKENNRFEYKNTGCLGVNSIGEGSYQLKRFTLKLIFDRKEQLIKSTVTITEKPAASDKEVVFVFNIKDQYGGPIFVFATEIGGNKDIGINREENKIILPKSNDKVNYEIHAVGYETVELELVKNTDKVIDIILFEGQPLVISERTIRWKLRDIKADEFKTGKEYWNTFRKVEK